MYYLIMRININSTNNIKFNGFKNVMVTEINRPPYFVKCFTVQLNNVGNNDLYQWQMIQKKLSLKTPLTDTIILSNINDGANEAYIANGYNISVSPEMCTINSKLEEKEILKFYTLVVSIMNRIQNSPFIVKNCAYLDKIADSSVKQLVKLGFSSYFANQIITSGSFLPASAIKNNAKSMENSIHKSVVKYLE